MILKNTEFFCFKIYFCWSTELWRYLYNFSIHCLYLHTPCLHFLITFLSCSPLSCVPLKGQSSELIFWVECKNVFVIGPILGTPNIFDFGLVFAEIFVFENRLLGIVYYGELMLCVLFTTQSQNSPSCLLRRVVRDNLFFNKSMTDLWKFAE